MSDQKTRHASCPCTSLASCSYSTGTYEMLVVIIDHIIQEKKAIVLFLVLLYNTKETSNIGGRIPRLKNGITSEVMRCVTLT